RNFEFSGTEAGFEDRLREVFPALESISVDYAVLEKAPNVLVLEASSDWDDLGSWGAWARRQPRDARGNVAFGDAVVVDCDDCVVVGEGGTAAAMGLRGMVVVHVNGATLTCPVAESESVRKVSEAVRFALLAIVAAALAAALGCAPVQPQGASSTAQPRTPPAAGSAQAHGG